MNALERFYILSKSRNSKHINETYTDTHTIQYMKMKLYHKSNRCQHIQQLHYMHMETGSPYITYCHRSKNK